MKNVLRNNVPNYREADQLYASNIQAYERLGTTRGAEAGTAGELRYDPGFGERLLGGGGSSPAGTRAEGRATARTVYDSMDDQSRRAAAISVRDVILDDLDKARTAGLEERYQVAAKFQKLQTEGALQALEDVFGEEGTRIVRRIRQFVDANDFARSIDPEVGSNTANKLRSGQSGAEPFAGPMGQHAQGASNAVSESAIADSVLLMSGAPPIISAMRAPGIVGRMLQPGQRTQQNIARTLLRDVERGANAPPRPPGPPPIAPLTPEGLPGRGGGGVPPAGSGPGPGGAPPPGNAFSRSGGGVAPTPARTQGVPSTPQQAAPPQTGMVRLYRAEPQSQQSGENIPDWVRETDEFANTMSATNRWFTDDLDEANWYVQNEYPGGKITYIDVPSAEAEAFRVSNMAQKEGGKTATDNPRAFSRRPEKELFVPAELAARRETVGFGAGGPGPVPPPPGNAFGQVASNQTNVPSGGIGPAPPNSGPPSREYPHVVTHQASGEELAFRTRREAEDFARNHPDIGNEPDPTRQSGMGNAFAQSIMGGAGGSAMGTQMDLNGDGVIDEKDVFIGGAAGTVGMPLAGRAGNAFSRQQPAPGTAPQGLFHGSPGRIEGPLRPSSDGLFGPGIYLTPDKTRAGTYAGEAGEIIEADITGRLAKYSDWQNATREAAQGARPGIGSQAEINQRAIANLEDQGFVGVEAGDTVTVWRPETLSQTRSQNANAFSGARQ